MLNEYLDKNVTLPLKNKLKKRFHKKIYNNAEYYTTRDVFKNLGVFKNGWVIHFTDTPFAIINNGFLGVDVEEIDNIWRTYCRTYYKRSTEKEGFAFAYDVNDIHKFEYNYGNYGLVFRTSGLKVYNAVDRDKQVVFNNKTANLKDCFIVKVIKGDKEISYDGYGDADVTYNKVITQIIHPLTRKIIFQTQSFDRAMNWIKTNNRQYNGLNTFRHSLAIKKLKDKQMQFINHIIDYVKTKTKNHVAVKWDKKDETVYLYYYNPLDDGTFISKKQLLNYFKFKRQEDDYFYHNQLNILIHFHYGISLNGMSEWKKQCGNIPEFYDDDITMSISYNEKIVNNLMSVRESIIKKKQRRKNLYNII